eukprot:1372561-Ditylum_brightwellii.AAC.1
MYVDNAHAADVNSQRSIGGHVAILARVAFAYSAKWHQSKGQTMIYKDDAAAIMMANASKPSGRTRNIDISYFVIQEWVSKGNI